MIPKGAAFPFFPSLYPRVPPCPGTGRIIPIPEGSALPSLLRVPARTSDSSSVLELSPLQAGRLPGRIPGSRASPCGDSAGVTVKVIPRAVSPAGQPPRSLLRPSRWKISFPGICQRWEFSEKPNRGCPCRRNPGWDFPTRIPPGCRSHPGASSTFQRAGESQFPGIFHACGDSRERLLPALSPAATSDPSPSHREQHPAGKAPAWGVQGHQDALSQDNGMGNLNWDKFKPAQHFQKLSFLPFPAQQGGNAELPQGISSLYPCIPIPGTHLVPQNPWIFLPLFPYSSASAAVFPCWDPRETRKVVLNP